MDDSKNSNPQVRFRVTPDELDRLTEIADEEGRNLPNYFYFLAKLILEERLIIETIITQKPKGKSE